MNKIDIYSDPRKPAYVNLEAGAAPLKNPVPEGTINMARAHHHKRMKDEVIKHDCAAILLYDPLNIRYATDCSDMQVWTLHNPSRYVLLFADGPTICFEYKQAMHLAEGLDMVDEVRPSISWFYFAAGQHCEEVANQWADDITDLMRQHGGGNMRLAIDKIEPLGLDALRARGVETIEGQQITEQARRNKCEADLILMDWTIKVCEAGMWRMRENSVAGKTENEIWAELHYENIRNGGEWIETRLLAIGERTNPWFQESSDHKGVDGDMLSFDTDLVGPYGYCADLSRSWTIGLVPPTDEQKRLYEHALNQITHNRDIIRPGMTYNEFNEKSWKVPEEFWGCRYSVAIHGVGLCDEYPAIPTHIDMDKGEGYDGEFLPGDVLCVETCTGVPGERECIKLEIQVLVTEDGVRQLDEFPMEDWV